MINMNAFGVRTACPAGNTGSRHAAHAAAAAGSAAPRKRRTAAATVVSVDGGST
jgi:hypothetical protein